MGFAVWYVGAILLERLGDLSRGAGLAQSAGPHPDELIALTGAVVASTTS